MIYKLYLPLVWAADDNYSRTLWISNEITLLQSSFKDNQAEKRRTKYHVKSSLCSFPTTHTIALLISITVLSISNCGGQCSVSWTQFEPEQQPNEFFKTSAETCLILSSKGRPEGMKFLLSVCWALWTEKMTINSTLNLNLFGSVLRKSGFEGTPLFGKKQDRKRGRMRQNRFQLSFMAATDIFSVIYECWFYINPLLIID